MKKLALSTAVILMSYASASQATPILTLPGSVTGTAGAITVQQSSGSTAITYLTPSANPTIGGDWTFDFGAFDHNTATTVNFTGNIYLGTYSYRTNVTLGASTMNGTVSVVNGNHAVSGTANWNNVTKTLTYSQLGASNDGSGSNWTDGGWNCTGSGTIFGNTVCGSATSASKDWEGLVLNFTFAGMDANPLPTFSGTIQGISTSGSGLTANTTRLNYTVAGTIPVPAAAWLFGSALVGLAGVARKRNMN